MTSSSDAHPSSGELDDLLNQHFAGKVVRKDLTKLLKEGANVPVYVLEYLLGSYCASSDDAVIEDGLKTVKKILAENYVRPDEAEKVKSVIRERGSLKVIDKVTVALNEKRDVYEALLGNLFADPRSWMDEFARRRQCLPRLATAREVGELVAFLLSGKARSITGQAIFIDGGTTTLLWNNE